jgi:NADPH:quinone reductase
MKAWLLPQFMGLQSLHLADVPDPVAKPGEIVLDLQFAALNPADRYLSEGQYPAKPPLPHVLGRDGIGVISAVGDRNTPDPRIGETRLILRGDTGVYRWGTFAQRVAVATDSIVKVPEGWSIQQAAAAPLVYLTAYQALTQWGDLPPSVVLITGASGGVGIAAIHLAKSLGHTVLALSRHPTKQQKLMQIGADHVFDPTDADWPKKVKQALSPRRVDLAIDNIGGPQFSQLIETLADHGRVSVVGRLAGPVPDFNTASLFFRRLKIGGVAVGAYSRPEAHAAWEGVVRILAKTGAKPLVDEVFDFEQLPRAFARLAAGPLGKVLLKIPPL